MQQEEEARGTGWGESPPATNVLAVKSADGQAMRVGHLALLFALHTCPRHLGRVASHVGWRVDNRQRMYLFITARQGVSGLGP